eukprot:727898-Pyramimonas_sp.AAC.1
MDPYPHIVVPNALPDDLYDKLAAAYPADQTIHHYAAGADKVIAIRALPERGTRAQKGAKVWSALIALPLA